MVEGCRCHNPDLVHLNLLKVYGMNHIEWSTTVFWVLKLKSYSVVWLELWRSHYPHSDWNLWEPAIDCVWFASKDPWFFACVNQWMWQPFWLCSGFGFRCISYWSPTQTQFKEQFFFCIRFQHQNCKMSFLSLPVCREYRKIPMERWWI